MLFRENGIDYDRVNYFNEPLDERRIKSLLKKLGIPAFGLLRTKETGFQELGFTENTPEDEIIAAIIANPGLLNRPIVETDEKAVIARPVEKALELIRSDRKYSPIGLQKTILTKLKMPPTIVGGIFQSLFFLHSFLQVILS